MQMCPLKVGRNLVFLNHVKYISVFQGLHENAEKQTVNDWGIRFHFSNSEFVCFFVKNEQQAHYLRDTISTLSFGFGIKNFPFEIFYDVEKECYDVRVADTATYTPPTEKANETET